MPNADELITQALRDRAGTVTADALRYPDFVPDRIDGRGSALRRRPARPALLTAVAAGVVVALGVAIGVYALVPGGRDGGTAGGGDAGLVGARWHLTGVRSATRAYPVPADYRTELRFTGQGRVSGLDGGNALAGTYRTSGHRITIRVTAAGTAGGTGTFPALEAMSSVYTPAALTDDSVTSTFTVTNDTLVLDTGHWTVTFSAGAAASGLPSPTPAGAS